MSLPHQAMLANLNVSQWTARKHDRKATQEVEQNHAAKDAGRFNKLLVNKDALEPINKAASALRDLHYTMTLPWGDNGDRLLPSRLYFKYTQEMGKLISTFQSQVDTFVRDYPQLVQDARVRLGTLYEPGDYPPASDIANRFAAKTSFMPVPDANDFRVDVAAADAKKIKDEITQMVAARQEQAVQDAFDRAKEIVRRVYERCSAEKPIIRDSLMGNLEELIDMLPSFNLTGDAKLTQLVSDMKELIHTSETLRTRPEVREAAARVAADLMQRMGWN